MGWVGSYTKIDGKSGKPIESRQGYVGHVDGIDSSEQVFPGHVNSYVANLFSIDQDCDYSQRVAPDNLFEDDVQVYGGDRLLVDSYPNTLLSRRKSLAERVLDYQQGFSGYHLDIRDFGQKDVMCVVLTRKDGRSYSGTFVTGDAVYAVMRKNKITGEDLNGLFFTAPGLIVINGDLSADSIRRVVEKLINTCSLDKTFTNADSTDSDKGESVEEQIFRNIDNILRTYPDLGVGIESNKPSRRYRDKGTGKFISIDAVTQAVNSYLYSGDTDGA